MHWLMLTIIFGALISSVLELVAPLLSGRIIDEVILQSGSSNKTFNNLVSLIIISFISTILFLILRSAGQRLGDHLAGRMRKFLTEKFYEKALTLP